MALVRWDPFSDMNTAFNRLTPRSIWSWPRLAWSAEGGSKFEWSPSADISETEKEYLVRAELPSVKKEDVHVSVDGGMITIEGERKQQKEEKNETYHRVESVYGSFSRSFSLPENVDIANIKCESKEGLLTVHIPKKEAEKHKPLEIKFSKWVARRPIDCTSGRRRPARNPIELTSLLKNRFARPLTQGRLVRPEARLASRTRPPRQERA